MAEQAEPLWIVEQAWMQVGRATTSEDRARALSTFRRAIATAQKHLGATPEVLERVRQLEAAASDLYADVADDHVRKAVRGLASLRMAVEARLGAHAGGQRVRIALVDWDGEASGGWQADRDEVCDFYGVPSEYRAEIHDVRLWLGVAQGNSGNRDGILDVQMSLTSSSPDVRLRRGRRLVWRSPSSPSRDRPGRRALPHEEPPGNGNGHHE